MIKPWDITTCSPILNYLKESPVNFAKVAIDDEWLPPKFYLNDFLTLKEGTMGVAVLGDRFLKFRMALAELKQVETRCPLTGEWILLRNVAYSGSPQAYRIKGGV